MLTEIFCDAVGSARSAGVALVEGQIVGGSFAHKISHGIDTGVDDDALDAARLSGLEYIPGAESAASVNRFRRVLLPHSHRQMRDPIAADHRFVHSGGIHDVAAFGDVVANDLVSCCPENLLYDGADPAA